MLSTRLLRTSGDPLFERLRSLLIERDIDPQHSVLAEFFPDDTEQEFGVLVTADRRVIEFVLHYGGAGDLTRRTSEACIGDLKDITDFWQAMPYASAIRAALDLASEA